MVNAEQLPLNSVIAVCCKFFLPYEEPARQQFQFGWLCLFTMGCYICRLCVSDVEGTVETINAQVSKHKCCLGCTPEVYSCMCLTLWDEKQKLL